jgi:hypothetical protein
MPEVIFDPADVEEEKWDPDMVTPLFHSSE